MAKATRVESDERYALRMKALALLKRSARPVNGVLCPQFTKVSRRPGMPTKSTLRRWWDQYGGADSQPQTLTRNRELLGVKAAEEGIREWHAYQIGQIRDAIGWILSPEHRGGDDAIRPDQLARALRDVAPVIDQILSTGSKEQEENRKSHSSRINRLQKAARRVGIVDPKAGG